MVIPNGIGQGKSKVNHSKTTSRINQDCLNQQWGPVCIRVARPNYKDSWHPCRVKNDPFPVI
jgi:hypothetical protein